MKKSLHVSKMMLQLTTLFILSLSTCTYSVSLAQPVANTSIPEILLQPFDASICVGGSHTFVVVAKAAESYQWYKGLNLIKGERSNTLTIENATKLDYELYSVVIENEVGSAVSNQARLWVADSLPEQIEITEYPDPAITGTVYKVVVEGFTDVYRYIWSSSLAGADFKPSPGFTNEATVVFSGAGTGNGIISVEMHHVCGNRTVTQDIQVKYPTGKTGIADNKAWVGPNPATTELNIDNKDLKIENVVVLNAAGQNIYQAKPNTADLQINTANWPKGIYLIKVTSEGKFPNVYKVIKK